MKNIYRHGDLVIKQIAKLPKKLNSRRAMEIVLAEGESTGHRHLLVAEPGTQIEILTDATGRQYLNLTGKAQLTHQEHKTLIIEKGIYIIEREREYDYFLEEIKQVRD